MVRKVPQISARSNAEQGCEIQDFVGLLSESLSRIISTPPQRLIQVHSLNCCQKHDFNPLFLDHRVWPFGFRLAFSYSQFLLVYYVRLNLS